MTKGWTSGCFTRGTPRLLYLRDFLHFSHCKKLTRVITRLVIIFKTKILFKLLPNLPHPMVSQRYKKQTCEIVKRILIILHGKIIMLVTMLVIFPILIFPELDCCLTSFFVYTILTFVKGM